MIEGSLTAWVFWGLWACLHGVQWFLDTSLSGLVIITQSNRICHLWSKDMLFIRIHKSISFGKVIFIGAYVQANSVTIGPFKHSKLSNSDHAKKVSPSHWSHSKAKSKHSNFGLGVDWSCWLNFFSICSDVKTYLVRFFLEIHLCVMIIWNIHSICKKGEMV